MGPQAVPATTGKQVPAGFAQVWQVPHDTLEQQVLSTQLFDMQSLAARQLPPFGFFVGGAHDIEVQTFPCEQSAAPPQLVRQLPALQT